MRFCQADRNFSALVARHPFPLPSQLFCCIPEGSQASNAAGAELQPPASHRKTDALWQWMRRQNPCLLATKMLPISSARRPPVVLAARESSHHAPADNAHHLLDETPRSRAGAIVRALTASSSTGDANVVASLHCASLKTSAVLDPPVRTSLLTAYARVRDASAAQALFGEATVAPDVILWNAAISALTLSRRYDDAAALFRRMARELGEFDSTTVVVMLSGASRAGNLEHGMALHGMAAKRCLDADHLSLWNALVDMYAKCGDFFSSEVVFQRMPCRDTTSWNSVISGSIFNGLSEVSAWYFKEMTRSIFQPDEMLRRRSLQALQTGIRYHGML
ncbi:pentatricopeptide repeat-containing protein At4g19220, mitochondrial-like [Setaria viridis]|uniref:pentatricopeptide repeat-containing protein At4g19220, mitochondrial-like n=1 Tax=Setaria viridis TaxID=4556 RepID=UPI003B3A1A58